MDASQFTPSDRRRFWSKVSIGSLFDCWEWQASTFKNTGYGTFGYRDGHMYSAHRVSWVLENGNIPDGLCVLHRCDNRKCVNPSHLFLGTKRDNRLDCKAKGRIPVGERHGMSVTSDILRDRMREMYASGVTIRTIEKSTGHRYSTIWEILHPGRKNKSL